MAGIMKLICFVVLMLISFERVQSSSLSNICILFHAKKGNFVITEATLGEGKWIRKSPQNQAINEGHSYTVCSSGEAFQLSGTEGRITITEISISKAVNVRWDINGYWFIGKNDFTIEDYDTKSLAVTCNSESFIRRNQYTCELMLR